MDNISVDANHAVLTGDYLLSVESVLRAGRRLRGRLDADRAKVEYATTQLERAAEQHEAGAAGYHAFMFSELEATADSDKTIRERTTEDALASIATDIQVGNVLIAGGQALGETGAEVEPRYFDDALRRLENTARNIDWALASPIDEGAEPGRLGFAEDEIAPDVVRSADLPSAIRSFERHSDETLIVLVEEAQNVVTGVVADLLPLDSSKVLASLSEVGTQVWELPNRGRLFTRGIRKLKEAIYALIRLLGDEALSRAKPPIERIFREVEEGNPLTQALEWAFAVEATRIQVARTSSIEGLEQEALDEASNALLRLVNTFREKLAVARVIRSGVNLSGVLLGLTPFVGFSVTPFIVSANVVILAAVVLIGMDYADSGSVLQRVRGVGEIVVDARPITST